MKHLLKFSSLLALTLTSVLFSGCNGEDGDPAPGVEEATQAGNIVMTFTGTYEGKAFSRTVDYKYAPAGAPYGSIWRTDANELIIAEVMREALPNSREAAGFALYLEDSNPRLRHILATAFITVADRKAFFISPTRDYVYEYAEVSDYSFNSSTGELKAKYAYTCAAGEYGNITESDINITVDIHVTLTQLLGNL
jgi:hypothetical protein